MIILGLLGLVFAVVGVLAVVIGGLSLLRGWVLAQLWVWFAVPLGAPVLSIPVAIGIALITGMLTERHSAATKDNRNQTEKNTDIAMTFVSPFLTLLMGYIVHRWI